MLRVVDFQPVLNLPDALNCKCQPLFGALRLLLLLGLLLLLRLGLLLRLLLRLLLLLGLLLLRLLLLSAFCHRGLPLLRSSFLHAQHEPTQRAGKDKRVKAHLLANFREFIILLSRA
jgi:hypothetical protein